MAILNIEATPSDDLRRYELAIDRKRVRMNANNKGTLELPGRGDDDNSEHTLTYSLVGPTGATLSVKVMCGDEVEAEIEGVEVYPEGEPFAAGWKDFRL